MNRLACLCFVLVTAASSAASAQSLYLPNGASGVGVEGGVSANADALALSVGGGYSYKTFIDAGAFVNRYSYDNTGSLTVSAIGFQPYATLHALRQSDTVPVSLAGMVNYQRYFFSVSENPSNLTISGWSMFFGGSVYRRFALRGAWSVIPQITVGYESLQTTGGTGIVARSPSAGSAIFQMAGNVGYQDQTGRVWLVNPFLAFDDRHATFGLSIGATFPFHRS
jgi:hypothetical protein